jgi:hypothetical protein
VILLKSKQPTGIMQNSVARIALGTAIILAIPVIGRWPWSPGDFIIMGALIAGTGFLLDLAIKKVDRKHRIPVCIAIVLGALFIWVQLAVDVIGQVLQGF